MRKKRRGQIALSAADKDYNRNISRYRIRVENHFAYIKQWKFVSHVFRGKDLSEHWKVYYAAEVLHAISKS